MIQSQNEPYELCVEIQRKIKDKRKKINSIKSLIDETNETQRQELNNEMYKSIEELKELKNNFKIQFRRRLCWTKSAKTK